MRFVDNHTKSLMNDDEDEVLEGVISKINSQTESPVEPPLLSSSDSIEPGLCGTACVKDGKILVSIPDRGQKPTVRPGEGVELYLNGILHNTAVQVSLQDKVEIKTKPRYIKGTCQIDVAKDKMDASIVIEPTRVVKYKVLDQPPQSELTVLTSKTGQEESPLSLPQMETLLMKNNINMESVDITEAVVLINNPRAGRVSVARGICPIPPVEAKIEIFFPQNDDNCLVESENGIVDYRSTKIFTVVEGTIIAKKIPTTPGKPGMNVFGEVISPPEANEISIMADKGTVLSQDGNEVYASKNGQPVLKKAGQVYIFSVEDILVKSEDIDIKTGNIFFNGSQVVLYGNVQESMTVQTSGQLLIAGHTYGAKLVSYDNMKLLGNTFRSSIRVGMDEKVIQAINSFVDSIEQDFRKIIRSINVLSEQSKVQKSRVSYGYLFKLMLEQMHKDLPQKVKKLENLIQSTLSDLPRSISEIFLLLDKILLYPHLINNEEVLTRLLQGIKLIQDYFHNIVMQKAKLELRASTNCQINVTGDVLVLGEGCFNTNLQAGGNVTIVNLFRGGEILAGGDVKIAEAGTRTGSKTLIETKSKQIKIQTCNEGVVIKIGKQSRVVKEKTCNLTAYMDEDGELRS